MKDTLEESDNCELCDGCGEIETVDRNSDRVTVGCPYCISREYAEARPAKTTGAIPEGWVLVPKTLIEQRPYEVSGGKGAKSTFRPRAGIRCLISPPNCDNEKGYIFQEFDILWSNEFFVLYGNDNKWPNLNKWDHVICKPLAAAPHKDTGGGI